MSTGGETASGLVAIRCDNHAAAIPHCGAAHYRAPGFRAAMRYLLFRCLWAGEQEKAARLRESPLRAKPDVALDRILHEPGYPAVTFRKSGLLARYGPGLAEL